MEEDAIVEANMVGNSRHLVCSCNIFFERSICVHLAALAMWKPYDDMNDYGLRGFAFRGRRGSGRPARAASALVRQ